MDPIVEVRDLCVEFETEFGVVHALKGVSFDVARGRTTAIVGESGSGKSVTANALLRLIQPPGRITQGSMRLSPQDTDAFDIAALPEGSDALYDLRGGHISMVFQEPMTALSPVYTIGNQVSEAILTHRNVTKNEARLEALAMLKQVGIPDAERRIDQYPFEFSGGMRQRVVIAMALVCRPSVLICDEPTTALDVTVQAEILALVRRMQAELGTSVIFITHDLGVVAQIADDVLVMYRGRIVESGSVRQILQSPAHPYTQGLLAALPGRGPRQPGARLATVDQLLAEANLDLDVSYRMREVAPGHQVALPETSQ